jgi:hypothetical protein
MRRMTAFINMFSVSLPLIHYTFLGFLVKFLNYQRRDGDCSESGDDYSRFIVDL